MADWFGKEVPKLGFGMMRLPKKGIVTDIEQTKKMVDLFMQAGFTYFDTAFVYPGSEAATKKALVDRYPRESYTICTKINAMLPTATEKSVKKQFETSLQRTGAGYFDYYLLHALMENNYRRYDKFGIWDFVKEKKEKGLIRHFGFSYHDSPELLDRLLRKHGKSIVVMEPVKGGKLAAPPKKVEKLFKSYRPDMSCASWAIRFVASLPGIITVLSGMSNIAQMEDNLSYMRDFEPLNDEEQEIIRQAQVILGSSAAIPCTACGYCTKGCPKGIAIPEYFAAMNKKLVGGQEDAAREAYRKAAQNGSAASACIECGQCEGACPQHLPIISLLKDCQSLE